MEIKQQHETVHFIQQDQLNNLPVLQMSNQHPQDDPDSPKAYQMCFPVGNLSILDEMNSNLSDAQKELLRHHYRLGHRCMRNIQDILKTKVFGWNDVIRRASRCPPPICSCCVYGKQHVKPVHRSQQPENTTPTTSSLRKDALFPGQSVSVDLFSVTEGGRTLDGKIQQTSVKGGAIFVDHCSSHVYIHPLTNFTATEILRAKVAYEVMMRSFGYIVMDYHADNGVFNSHDLQRHLQNGDQTLTLSGVGAKFQNGYAERNIGVIIAMARTMLLHAMSRWSLVSLSYWTFAVEYAVKLHNMLPRSNGAPPPLEILSKGKIPGTHYKDLHVFGAPTYILIPALQDGHKIPKWRARSKQGMFLGHSKHHASSVAMVLNLATNIITPQYHVVIDDWFTTCASHIPSPALIDQWATMFPDGLFSVLTDSDDAGISEDWLLEDELARRRSLRPDTVSPSAPTITRMLPGTPIVGNHENRSLPSSTNSSPRSESQRERSLLPGPSVPLQPSSQRENVPTLQRETQVVSTPSTPPAPQTPTVRFNIDSSPAPIVAPTVIPVPTPPPPQSNTPSVIPSRPPNPPGPYRRSRRERRSTTRFSDDSEFDRLYASLASVLNIDPTILNDLAVNYGSHVDELNPICALQAALSYGLPSLSDPDTLRYHEMLASTDRELFETAMDKEIYDLEGFNTWRMIKRSQVPKEKKVLPSTWTFRRKRSSDGSITKHKARFCVRGDLQKDVEDRYSPVAQSTTIRLMLILTLLRKLVCTQVDYNNAFAQAPLDDPIYIEIPKGFFSEEEDTVLLHERSLYGLVQAPKLWYEHLKDNLIARGFTPSEFDPCLFISKKVICVVYVDDCLFFSSKQEYVNEVIESLRKDMTLTIEGNDIAKFLGINYTKQDANTYNLSQSGLTQKVINAVGLSNCKPDQTPAAEIPLSSQEDSPPFEESWNYRSVVGMFMYLANQTRPDIAFAVHQVARYSHNPKEIHGKAVKRIVRYLAGTKDKGLIFKSDFTVGLQMFCDADFAGLWKSEDSQNADSVRSRTGFVIKLYGCPLLWTSRIQTEIACSTLEAEYIALSSGMRELLPIRNLYLSLATHMRFPDAGCSVRCTVFEDNQGALGLATAPKITPRTKHIGVKYHFFRQNMASGEVSLGYIESEKQQADILTKGLSAVKFVNICKLLLGW